MPPTSKNQDLARAILQAFILRGAPIVAGMFNRYRAEVMPPEAGPIQVLECKRAYFAGCRSILDLMFAAADSGPGVTAKDEQIMAAIEAELAAYINEGQFREHADTIGGPAKGRA